MYDIKAVQQKLIDLGYDLGPGKADGVIGRATTAAVKAFQEERGLSIRYPGTIGEKTLSALGFDAVGVKTTTDIPTEPLWMIEARRYLGLHERKDAATLNKALRLTAKDIPWCGAFVGMVIAATLPRELLPANPLGARNWLKFGKALDRPQVGAIAVFWRGSKTGWSGHVGFVVGHDKTHLHILGGNQSDSVSIARIAKDRCLGYRQPATSPPLRDDKALPFTTIAATITTNEA